MFGGLALISATVVLGATTVAVAPIGAQEPVIGNSAVGIVDAEGNPSSSEVVTPGLRALVMFTITPSSGTSGFLVTSVDGEVISSHFVPNAGAFSWDYSYEALVAGFGGGTLESGTVERVVGPEGRSPTAASR
jgi:hypothetical protein